jgi:hypothetical protein
MSNVGINNNEKVGPNDKSNDHEVTRMKIVSQTVTSSLDTKAFEPLSQDIQEE